MCWDGCEHMDGVEKNKAALVHSSPPPPLASDGFQRGTARVSALSMEKDDARAALGAFRFTLEYAVRIADGKPVSMTIPGEAAEHLLSLLTPDDADADRDELWLALQRVAWNLCSCHAEPGGSEAPPVDPSEHAETCSYVAALSPIAQEDTGPIEWDDPNLSLAESAHD